MGNIFFFVLDIHFILFFSTVHCNKAEADVKKKLVGATTGWLDDNMVIQMFPIVSWFGIQ